MGLPSQSHRARKLIAPRPMPSRYARRPSAICSAGRGAFGAHEGARLNFDIITEGTRHRDCAPSNGARPSFSVAVGATAPIIMVLSSVSAASLMSRLCEEYARASAEKVVRKRFSTGRGGGRRFYWLSLFADPRVRRAIESRRFALCSASQPVVRDTNPWAVGVTSLLPPSRRLYARRHVSSAHVIWLISSVRASLIGFITPSGVSDGWRRRARLVNRARFHHRRAKNMQSARVSRPEFGEHDFARLIASFQKSNSRALTKVSELSKTECRDRCPVASAVTAVGTTDSGSASIATQQGWGGSDGNGPRSQLRRVGTAMSAGWPRRVNEEQSGAPRERVLFPRSNSMRCSVTCVSRGAARSTGQSRPARCRHFDLPRSASSVATIPDATSGRVKRSESIVGVPSIRATSQAARTGR